MKKDLLVIFMYAFFSAVGLMLLKIGVSNGTSFRLKQNMLNINLNLVILVGFCFYLLSFALSLFAMSRLQLSVFYPLSIGLTYILVCASSIVVLKETVSLQQLIGAGIILIGIVFMVWR